MNKSPFLPILCFLLLVSLLAVPALAATVTCPADCTCLIPAEAKKLSLPGYCNGKQAVCGYDAQKNEKYCYAKTVVKTTTTAPQIIAVVKIPVTTIPTTLPHVAGPTRIVPVTCPSTCECMPDEKAQGAAVPLSLCSGTKSYCGSTASGTAMYCYTLPTAATTTTPTTVPAMRVATVSCGSGCSCLAPDKADAAGYKKCSGSAQPCDYDPAGRPMACYVTDRATTVVPKPVNTMETAATGSRTSGEVSAPAFRPESTLAVTAPARSDDIFSIIGSFFGSLFGRNTVKDPQLERPTDPSLPLADSQAFISMCRSRFGLDSCNGACVDLSTDNNNCGRCGNACYFSEICCSGTCITNRSSDNCGTCGNVCPAGSPCQNGACDQWGCYYGHTLCNKTCVNLYNDRNNCGACGNACPSSTVCEGSCKVCPFGKTACGFDCVSLTDDRRNCGACRNTCADDAVCSDGICVTCAAGTIRCGDSCANTLTDAANCGRCGSPCPAGTNCNNGECVCPEFSTGTIACPVLPIGNVVCVDSMNDEENCGGCGRSGISGNHHCSASQTCCSGVCVDLMSDRSSCGTCGNICEVDKVRGARLCRAGTCVYCDPGYDGCIGDSGVVSCINLRTSPHNCGACGNVCADGQSCCNGVCKNLNSDRENCGTCGNACGSGEACCDGVCKDNLYDENNCGDCGHHCNRPDRNHCNLGRCCNAVGLNCE